MGLKGRKNGGRAGREGFKVQETRQWRNSITKIKDWKRVEGNVGSKL